MSGHHGRTANGGRQLTAAMAATVALAGLEVVAGLRSGSLALMSDAIHLGTDVGALALATFAAHRARRGATGAHTYGFHRTGILVATLNGLLLIAVAGMVAATAAGRLQHPAAIDALPVMVVAGIALVVNGGIVLLLHGGGGDLGVRSAMFHVAGDAAAAAGVLVAGVVIVTTGWMRADAVVSILIAGLISLSAFVLLREAMLILIEATPRDIDPLEVERAIAGVAGIEGVHDLHIWSLNRRHRALSAHVIVGDRPLAEVTATVRVVETVLCSRFAIEHATLQPEFPGCEGDALYCDLDERHLLAHTPATRATPS